MSDAANVGCRGARSGLRCAVAAALGVTVAAATLSASRAADTEAATVVANQIRRQGFKCEEPVRAERDAKASRPHGAVWTLHCKDVSYRVRLVPDSAAKVEKLDK